MSKTEIRLIFTVVMTKHWKPNVSQLYSFNVGVFWTSRSPEDPKALHSTFSHSHTHCPGNLTEARLTRTSATCWALWRSAAGKVDEVSYPKDTKWHQFSVVFLWYFDSASCQYTNVNLPITSLTASQTYESFCPFYRHLTHWPPE